MDFTVGYLFMAMCVVMLTHMYFEPKFLINYQTGDLELWYNGKDRRTYKIIYPKFKKIRNEED